MAKAPFTVNKLETNLFDSRLVSRNIAKGVLSPAAYKKHVEGLSDLSSEAETIEVVLGEDPDLDCPPESTEEA